MTEKPYLVQRRRIRQFYWKGRILKLGMNQRQAFEAQRAADTAALNGVVYLAMLLRRHQLITAEEIEHLHSMMSKPLNLNENADNPLVQNIHQHLDEQFAAILKLI